MKYLLLLPILLFAGCQSDDPTHTEKITQITSNQIKFIAVEGDAGDQWEIWEDTVSGKRILCHHSGYTGSPGGRSTSCVVVTKP